MNQTVALLRRIRDAVGQGSVGYPMLLLALADNYYGLEMGGVADSLGVSHAAATGIVDVAESKGLVARHPHVTDRRVRLVRITVHGKQVVKGGKGS